MALAPTPRKMNEEPNRTGNVLALPLLCPFVDRATLAIHRNVGNMSGRSHGGTSKSTLRGSGLQHHALSTAAPAPKLVPVPADNRASKNAAMESVYFLRTGRSNQDDRSKDGKKSYRDYPRTPHRQLPSRLPNLAPAAPPALLFALGLSRLTGAVLLLRFPAVPLLGLLPTSRAAVSLQGMIRRIDPAATLQ